MEMIVAGVAFVVLFTGWVVVPTMIKKHHALKASNEDSSEYPDRLDIPA